MSAEKRGNKSENEGLILSGLMTDSQMMSFLQEEEKCFQGKKTATENPIGLRHRYIV